VDKHPSKVPNFSCFCDL